MILEDDDGENYLDRTFLDLFLVRSQIYPLDVLIDARDPSWNFNGTEPKYALLFMHNTNTMITYFLFLAYLSKQDPMFIRRFFLLTI